MIEVSEEFRLAMRTSQTVVAKAEVWRGEQLVVTLPIHSGTVTKDRTAKVRSIFSCTVADVSGLLAPETAADTLAPFGSVVKLYSGVQHVSVSVVERDEDTAAEWTSGALAGTTVEGDDLVLTADIEN